MKCRLPPRSNESFLSLPDFYRFITDIFEISMTQICPNVDRKMTPFFYSEQDFHECKYVVNCMRDIINIYFLSYNFASGVFWINN